MYLWVCFDCKALSDKSMSDVDEIYDDHEQSKKKILLLLRSL